jgi:hypothetical protein
MTIQNYLIIENNIVANIVVWDGNSQTWNPPLGSIQIVQSVAPAMVWEPVIVDKQVTDYALVQKIGVADIGFTWDGTVFTTNQPKPELPVQQPFTTGTQTA